MHRYLNIKKNAIYTSQITKFNLMRGTVFYYSRVNVLYQRQTKRIMLLSLIKTTVDDLNKNF